MYASEAKKTDLNLGKTHLKDDKAVEKYANLLSTLTQHNFLSINEVHVNIQPILKSLQNHSTILRLFICIVIGLS